MEGMEAFVRFNQQRICHFYMQFIYLFSDWFMHSLLAFAFQV